MLLPEAILVKLKMANDAKQTKLLCFGIGNVSRGDDALGPSLLDFIEAETPLFQITKEEVFQLQPENLYELSGQDVVLFLDADARFKKDISFESIEPHAVESAFVSHALSPQRLLSMHQELADQSTPAAFLLSMGAADTELHEGLSEQGKLNLDSARQLISTLLNEPLQNWKMYQKVAV